MSHFVRLLVLSLLMTWAMTCALADHVFAAEPLAVPALAAGLVSSRQPNGLILSTGNLYFTSHDGAGAAVWRMAQTATPGQESVLYWEAGAIFGDIIFAKVGNNFFGYFFAQDASGITIRRVPLTGGNAIVLATVTDVDIVNSHRNLITDGVNLYWQDVSAVRKMPIGGGPVTVLDNANPNTPTAGLALQGSSIIYASVADIRFVPMIGAITPPSLRTIVTASSRVTALYAVSNGVYWGDESGAVHLKVGTTTTTLPSTPGLATSISTNGSAAGAAQAWTECGSQSCQLSFLSGANHVLTTVGGDALGVSVTPSSEVFWGDAAGVHRQVF